MSIDSFTDSKPLLGRPRDLKARLDEEGYLYFRGLVDRDRVARTRAAVLDAIAGCGWLAEGSDPADALPGGLVRREADENWWGGYTAIQSSYEFHALAHEPEILEVARLLLGDEILVHPRSIGRVTYPSSEHPTPPHQDFPLIQGAADVFTCWVPLGDIGATFGALRVLRGSHHEGLRRVIAAQGVGGVGVEVDQDDPNWATADYRMGDILLFHAFSVHWAPPNRADSLRLSADYRYQALADPVVQGSLLPHGHPNIPHWSELTKGWPDPSIVQPSHDNLNLVEIQNPMEAIAPPSRLVHL